MRLVLRILCVGVRSQVTYARFMALGTVCGVSAFLNCAPRVPAICIHVVWVCCGAVRAASSFYACEMYVPRGDINYFARACHTHGSHPQSTSHRPQFHRPQSQRHLERRPSKEHAHENCSREETRRSRSQERPALMRMHAADKPAVNRAIPNAKGVTSDPHPICFPVATLSTTSINKCDPRASRSAA